MGLPIKRLLSGIGRALVRQFGSTIEQEAIKRIDRVEDVAQVLIAKGSDKAKAKVKRQIERIK